MRPQRLKSILLGDPDQHWRPGASRSRRCCHGRGDQAGRGHQGGRGGEGGDSHQGDSKVLDGRDHNGNVQKVEVGQDIRPVGSDIMEGEVVLGRGALMGPGEVSSLVSEKCFTFFFTRLASLQLLV